MGDWLTFDTMTTWEALQRLLAATLLPFAIGLERFVRRKPIDYRPYVIISVVACGVLIATKELLGANLEGNERIDPSRVMQGVITGIGFLGAGAMYRDGDFVKGAGSAATIWGAGVIGVVCGVGEIGIAVMLTGIILLLMILSAPFTRRWDNESSD